MSRFMWCCIVMFTTMMTMTASAEMNRKYFVGGSPGIVLDGELEAVGHIFVGVEGTLGGALGYSADVGYLAHVKSLGSGAGVISVGGLFFPTRSSTQMVFVALGYTLGFQGGVGQRANFMHTGLGMRLGAHVRLEVRNYVNFDGGDPNTYVWAFRVGWIF